MEQNESLNVIKNLHCISLPTPFPVGAVNVYLAEGEELTLIDVGPKFPPALEALTSGLARHGHKLEELRRVILTHHHADHVGLTAQIVKQSGAEVLTNPLNFPWLQDYESVRSKQTRFYRKFWKENGVPEKTIASILALLDSLAMWFENSPSATPLVEGSVIDLADRTWRVYHTPGHAGGLICLWQPETRTLLSNDHLLPDVSSNPILEPPPPGEKERPRRLLDYLRELNRMSDLNPAVALPGHGAAIYSVRELVHDRLAFHEQRAQAILNTLGERSMTLWQLTTEYFPTLSTPEDFFLGISEMQGHLDLLEERRRAIQEDEGGLIMWRRRTLGSDNSHSPKDFSPTDRLSPTDKASVGELFCSFCGDFICNGLR